MIESISNLFKKKSKDKHRIYLDNAGATKLSDKARAELLRTLGLFGNASAIHHEGDVASRALDVARNRCALSLNAHAYEIYFASSGTESCNMAVLGTYLGAIKNLKFKIGNSLPHIIVSCIEHPSVLEPIRHLEKEGKVRVTYLRVYNDGVVKVSDIAEALCEDTILVSVMYANNEIGTIQPIKEIGRKLEEWKRTQGRSFNEYPYLHTDACQATNYLNMDVVRLKCHLMTVNSSKCYGPKGVALLYKREGIHLEPIVYGGGQERALHSGTEAVPLISSFSIALEEAVLMRDKEVERLTAIRDFAIEELQKNISGMVIYGVLGDKRLPNNINCRVPKIISDEMIIRLDALGFAVSHKSACASAESNGSYVIEALGVDKSEALENIRITLGRDTTKRDLEKLVVAMKDIQTQFGK
jgi:cysteine desulfurase